MESKKKKCLEDVWPMKICFTSDAHAVWRILEEVFSSKVLYTTTGARIVPVSWDKTPQNDIKRLFEKKRIMTQKLLSNFTIYSFIITLHMIRFFNIGNVLHRLSEHDRKWWFLWETEDARHGTLSDPWHNFFYWSLWKAEACYCGILS